MADMTDMMVDVETTGTNPHTAGIIQLSAIKFNYDTGEIGELFDRCPVQLPFRNWSDSTREFWLGGNRKVYESIVIRAEPAEPVYKDFVKYASHDAPDGGYRFWAKPVTFDWGFVSSHLEQLALPMPFSFRIARDLNTFCAALKGNPEHPDIESGVEFHGDKHNGLHDCAFQIDCLMAIKNRYLTAEIMP